MTILFDQLTMPPKFMLLKEPGQRVRLIRSVASPCILKEHIQYRAHMTGGSVLTSVVDCEVWSRSILTKLRLQLVKMAAPAPALALALAV